MDVFGELRSIFADPEVRWTWHHVHALLITVEDRDYLERKVIPYALECLQAHDSVRQVRKLADLKSPVCLLATELAFVGVYPEGSLKEIIYSPYVQNITRLGICGGWKLSSSDLQELACSPYLKNLQKLFLPAHKLGAEGAKFLAGYHAFRGLRDLNVSRNNLGDQGAQYLAQSRILRSLEKIVLENNALTDEGITFLAQSEILKTVTHLDLHMNGVTDEGAWALAQSPHLKNLELLDLRWNHITPLGESYLREAGLPHRTSYRYPSTDPW